MSSVLDFDYLGSQDIYLDAACQSLRPRPVIDALNQYYLSHNSCGERVKYRWGTITDQKVSTTRQQILDYLKLKKRDYFVSFTLNTTYGLNLLLSQLNLKKANLQQIVTSDIEHNSPFLATLTCAHKHQISRKVITRLPDGSINLADIPERSLVVVNSASNIDGRQLLNLDAVIKKVHQTGGIIIIDAAQAMAHSSKLLHKTAADAICFSAHKLYAPSLGGMIIKKSLLPFIDTTFIGGGMVDDVNLDTYQLSSIHDDHFYTKFESGLQAWGEIIALGTALDWLNHLPKSASTNLQQFSQELFDFLSSSSKVHLINQAANPTTSFYIEGVNSHLLGAALADQGIMARTGYFCVHYYLDHLKHFPPLIRFSMGYHTRPSDLTAVFQALAKII